MARLIAEPSGTALSALRGKTSLLCCTRYSLVNQNLLRSATRGGCVRLFVPAGYPGVGHAGFSQRLYDPAGIPKITPAYVAQAPNSESVRNARKHQLGKI